MIMDNGLLKNSDEAYQFLTFPIKYDVTNRNLYNLFSNFGNVSFIKQTRERAYIKYRSYEFAAIAKNYLTGYTLQGNVLELEFVESTREAMPCESEFSQVNFFDTSFDRYVWVDSGSIAANPYR
jgi:RNA recognition motif-containing protein